MTTEHGPHTTRPRPPGPYVTSPTWSGRPTEDLSWHNSGRCSSSDPDLFHPEIEEGHGTSAMAAVANAKKVCHGCPVKAPCLVYSIEKRERYGVWGGLGRTVRDRLLRTLPDRADSTGLEQAA